MVEKVRKLENKVKSKKRKGVVIESDEEQDEAKKDIDLDGFHFLAKASLESARVVDPAVPMGVHDHPDDEQPDDAQLSSARRSQLQRLIRKSEQSTFERNKVHVADTSGMAPTSSSIPVVATSLLVDAVMEDVSAKISTDGHSTDVITADQASTGVGISSDPIPSDLAVTHIEPIIPSGVSSVRLDKGKSVMMEADTPVRQRTKK